MTVLKYPVNQQRKRNITKLSARTHLSSVDWEKIYLLPIKTTLDTKLRELQYRILNRILHKNKILFLNVWKTRFSLMRFWWKGIGDHRTSLFPLYKSVYVLGCVKAVISSLTKLLGLNSRMLSLGFSPSQLHPSWK